MPSEAHQAIVAALREQGPLGAGEGEVDIAAMREGMEAMTSTSELPEGTQCEVVDAGGVPAEWIEGPDIDRGRVLLYFHGGGYVLGSIATHRAMVAQIAAEAGVRALIIDYRLAPEHPFPAAVEDAVAAYRFLLDDGYKHDQIALGGDSAGGGLTLACLLALRDADEPLPEAAILLSPWVDLEGVGESMTTRAEADPMVARDGLLKMAAFYLNGESARNPLAAPLHADLSRLPPLYIQAGTAETLLDDATRIEEKARKSGVPTEMDLYPDLIHVFQAFAPHVPESVEAIKKLGAYLRRQF
ncbi:MAG: alpha/beta hydrolase [Myxococcota bacterium]|nr:alpha/beta hydrolase [Myxococcota bacterium]